MLLRNLIVLLALSLPFAASADVAASPAPAPTTSDVSQSGSDASTLGPAASGGPGSSSADGGSLQPAGGSPLQSTTSDSSGLTAPTSSTLQEPVAPDSGELQVIADSVDGTQNDPSTTSNGQWGWLGFSLLFGFMAAAISLVVRRRPHFLIHLRTHVSKLSLRH